jgi:hypothetical protein
MFGDSAFFRLATPFGAGCIDKCLVKRSQDRDRVQYGSRLSGDAPDCGAVDAKETGDIGAAASGGEHAENFGSLMRHKRWTPPADAALFAGRLEAGAGSLAHHGAFEFSKAAEHLHHHASHRATIGRIAAEARAILDPTPVPVP